LGGKTNAITTEAIETTLAITTERMSRERRTAALTLANVM
jgi:hypothetical protein